MKRLFDDPALSSELRVELREELQRSRRAGEDYDVQAKLPMLLSALSAPAPMGDQLLSEAKRVRWPRLHLGHGMWKIAGLVAIGGVSLFAAWPAHRTPTASTPMSALHATEPLRAPPAAIVEPAVEPAPAPDEAPAMLPRAIPQTTAPSSRREIEQLVHIRALLEHDPSAAARLAQRSEQEFPNGALSEERRALQVLALSKAGSAQAAERKAQQFFLRYPQSPLREQIHAALKQ